MGFTTTVYEIPGEPAVLINGVPDIVPGDGTVPPSSSLSSPISAGAYGIPQTSIPPVTSNPPTATPTTAPSPPLASTSTSLTLLVSKEAASSLIPLAKENASPTACLSRPGSRRTTRIG
ncbi:hypothetical protein RJT34_32586 [Clitoria ternatea]|uniref:Uncharacterized protein n=1 Tax=Clitoria ternatea TaxID=43366 RepID=A0AAN9EWR5_CLITE